MLDCLLLCIQSNDKEITFHRLVDDLRVYSACILQSSIAKRSLGHQGMRGHSSLGLVSRSEINILKSRPFTPHRYIKSKDGRL